MNSDQLRSAYILAALSAAPLSRLQLMKTLFLYWHRNGRPSGWAFSFEPYLYGPCAFDAYDTLRELELAQLVVQSPQQSPNKAPYFLTRKGFLQAWGGSALTKQEEAAVREIATWAGQQSFQTLLRHVYTEAPDFATNSIVKRLAR